MEKKYLQRSLPSRHGGGAAEKPSFSTTLLDAIYRSIDNDNDEEEENNRCARGATREPCFPCSIGSRKQIGTTATAATANKRNNAAASEKEKSVIRRNCNYNYNYNYNYKQEHHRHAFQSTTATSSSSESSSFGGFSSSDTEPALRHRAGLRPIRTGAPPPSTARSEPPPPPPPPEKKKKKSRSGSIGSRIRDLRRSKAPASPGARLASFINSLFTAARKAKAAEEPVCSTASSNSRSSCLSKAPSTRERRSVRFDQPVSVVVEPKCRVEELLRGFEEEEESDSSSDLFELENLKAAIEGGRRGGGYRDELPVFETTNLRLHRTPSLRF